ncbi:MAG: ABC transporter permease [Armatimonadota bacterium]
MASISIAFLSIIETMRRKEFYVILILILGLAGWMAVLDTSMPGSGRFAKQIVMQVVWLVSIALAVSLSARQVPTDLEQKTVYVLMSRPITRTQYIIGRILGAASASIICFTLLFLVLILMMLLKGIPGIGDPALWESYILQITAIFMICSITVLFSVTGTSAGAVTLMFLIYVVMRYWGYAVPEKIAAMVPSLKIPVWFVYLLMPHFEFMDISQRVVHSLGVLPLKIFLGVVFYAGVYTIFISSAASVLFRKRRL